MSDFVYFVFNASDGFTKIGKTSNFHSRMGQLEYEKGDALTVERLIKCDSSRISRDLELELHSVFADSRKSGEWFDLSVADRACPISLPSGATVLSRQEINKVLSQGGYIIAMRLTVEQARKLRTDAKADGRTITGHIAYHLKKAGAL